MSWTTPAAVFDMRVPNPPMLSRNAAAAAAAEVVVEAERKVARDIHFAVVKGRNVVVARCTDTPAAVEPTVAGDESNPQAGQGQACFHANRRSCASSQSSASAEAAAGVAIQEWAAEAKAIGRASS